MNKIVFKFWPNMYPVAQLKTIIANNTVEIILEYSKFFIDIDFLITNIRTWKLHRPR